MALVLGGQWSNPIAESDLKETTGFVDCIFIRPTNQLSQININDQNK